MLYMFVKCFRMLYVTDVYLRSIATLSGEAALKKNGFASILEKGLLYRKIISFFSVNVISLLSKNPFAEGA